MEINYVGINSNRVLALISSCQNFLLPYWMLLDCTKSWHLHSKHSQLLHSYPETKRDKYWEKVVKRCVCPSFYHVCSNLSSHVAQQSRNEQRQKQRKSFKVVTKDAFVQIFPKSIAVFRLMSYQCLEFVWKIVSHSLQIGRNFSRSIYRQLRQPGKVWRKRYFRVATK